MMTRWTTQQIQTWYAQQPWLVGCNFIPSTAINQLEMWQEETFDPATIRQELGWAASLGMNTVRVFLHNLAWSIQPDGFKQRINQYLSIAAEYKIRTIFVLFDDCWYPDAKPGPQPIPKPGMHNSGWLQSPGVKVAADRSQWKTLEAYIRDIVTTYREDDRVLLWDVYNELGNIFLGTLSLPVYRRIPQLTLLFLRYQFLDIRTLPLFRAALSWVRESNPSQPITACVWLKNRRLDRELIESSDIITFHNYQAANPLSQQIRQLKKYNRPMLCTEFMARTAGSRFETCLPVFKQERVGCYCWGLVSGKTQTIYSWADRGSDAEPALWFHDIFRKDGTPFSQEEVDFIRNIRV